MLWLDRDKWMRHLPVPAASKASDAGAWVSILCAVMRLDGVVLPACSCVRDSQHHGPLQDRIHQHHAHLERVISTVLGCWTAVARRLCEQAEGFQRRGDWGLACAMLGPGESRPRRRIVEVVMMLVSQDPACAAAESGLVPARMTQRR